MKDDRMFSKINSSALIGALLFFSGMASNSFLYTGVNSFFLFSMAIMVVMLFIVKSMAKNEGARSFVEVLVMTLASVVVGGIFESIEMIALFSIGTPLMFPFYKNS